MSPPTPALQLPSASYVLRYLLVALTWTAQLITVTQCGGSSMASAAASLGSDAAPSLPAEPKGGGGASGDDSGTGDANETASDHIFNSLEEEEGYWREVKAIIGGVLGFWGGVGVLGGIFLVIVLSQRYCCKKDDGKEDGDG